VRMSLRSSLLPSAFGVLAALLAPSRADACSYSLGFDPPRVYCEKKGEIPANAIIDKSSFDGLADASLFEAESTISSRFAACVDQTLRQSDARCASLFRLRPNTPAGTVVRSREQNPYECPLDVTVVGEADTTPPPRPILADAVIDMKRDPADTGCYSCPDVDSLTFFVTNVKDDRAPRRLMHIAVYVAPTVEQVRDRTTIDHLLSVFEASEVGVGPKATIDPANGPAAAAQAYLGKSVGRERTATEGIFRGGPLCFAVESMDAAGNLSPRSEALCLDHRDENDPRVRFEDGGCACTIHRSPHVGSVLVVVATLLGLAMVTRGRGKR
jgi:hypothetical protein